MRLPAAHWAEIVSAHHASGLSMEQFARRNQISPKSLWRWRRRLRPTDPVGFVEVHVAKPLEVVLPSPVAPVATLRVELQAAGVAIDVPAGADLAWLRQIVQALT
jgi:hypothetical protein